MTAPVRRTSANRRSPKLPVDNPPALFAAAFDHVADLIAICDARGRLVFLNPAARDLAMAHAIGSELNPSVWGEWYAADGQIVPPEEWPLWRALRGETLAEVEGYRTSEDGTRFWMLLSAAPIRDANGAIIGAVATSKDISERRRAEETTQQLNEDLARRVGARTQAFESLQRDLEREVRERLGASELLERSRRMLQSILDRSAAVIYVKDSSFRYLLVNSEFERLFGVSNAGLAGRTDYDVFSSDIVAPLRANDSRVLAEGTALQFEEVAPLEDGLHTYVSVKFPLRADDGTIYGLCGISTDITDRKAMEAELSRSQETLSAVIESSPDPIFLVDRNQQLVVWNSVLSRLVESTGAKSIAELQLRLPTTLTQRWALLFDRALNGERLTVEEMVPTNGTVRHLLISLNPTTDAGKVSGVTVFGRDITALREAEGLVRRHQAELAHVLRLHTMGEMAANLAHEINQPLGAIANYAQGSLRRLGAGTMALSEVRTVLAEIAKEALRAGQITRRVRELLRKEEPRREMSDINQIVAAALEVVAPTARERGSVIRFYQATAAPVVQVDPIQIEQVVLNLIVNALEAGESGGRAGDVEVRTAVIGSDCVEVVVSDSGVGIPPALVEQMFEPFYTTKSQGLGMGLAISRSIIDAHDGRLWAVANPAGGMVFRFTLPAVAPADE